jgi:hypothetical protein
MHQSIAYLMSSFCSSWRYKLHTCAFTYHTHARTHTQDQSKQCSVSLVIDHIAVSDYGNTLCACALDNEVWRAYVHLRCIFVVYISAAFLFMCTSCFRSNTYYIWQCLQLALMAHVSNAVHVVEQSLMMQDANSSKQ